VETVKGLVEGGDYIAILPESAVHAEVASHRLAAVPFTDAGCTEPLGVIYLDNEILKPAVKNFIQFLKQPTGQQIETADDADCADFQFQLQLSEFQFFHLPAMTTFIHFLKQRPGGQLKGLCRRSANPRLTTPFLRLNHPATATSPCQPLAFVR